MKGKQVEGPLRVSKRTFLSKVAARAGVPVAVVHQVYRAMVAELLEIDQPGGLGRDGEAVAGSCRRHDGRLGRLMRCRGA